jgi:hypothetical protein
MNSVSFTCVFNVSGLSPVDISLEEKMLNLHPTIFLMIDLKKNIMKWMA